MNATASTSKQTLELSGSELRSAAFAAIRKELGVDGLIRFLAENFSQAGRDYTEERRNLPNPSAEEISERIAALKKERGGTLAPAGARTVSRSTKAAKAGAKKKIE